MNTHYGVIVFGGDPAGEHPDVGLRGQAPRMEFLCSGPEEFCWEAVARWTAEKPLRMWETAEVLTRDPSVVRAEGSSLNATAELLAANSGVDVATARTILLSVLEMVKLEFIDKVVHDDDLGPTLPGNHTSGKEA